MSTINGENRTISSTPLFVQTGILSVMHRGRLRGLWGGTLSERKLGLFFGNLQRYISSGAPLSSSVVSAAAGLGDELQCIAQALEEPLRRGVSFHQAFVPYRHSLPEMTLPVLETGVVSGTLDDACGLLARAFMRIDEFSVKFKRVAVEPGKIIAGAAALRMVFSVGSPLDHVFLSALSAAAEAALVLFALFTGYRLMRRWPAGLVLVDKIHLAIPHVGAVARNLATARWVRAFATMWHAGVPISQALDVASRSTLNAYYEREMQKAVRLTRQGVSLSESLRGIELTPQHFLPLLHAGEVSGRFAEALDGYVEALEDEAIVKAQQEANTAMVVVYLGAGLMTFLIAMAAFTPGS